MAQWSIIADYSMQTPWVQCCHLVNLCINVHYHCCQWCFYIYSFPWKVIVLNEMDPLLSIVNFHYFPLSIIFNLSQSIWGFSNQVKYQFIVSQGKSQLSMVYCFHGHVSRWSMDPFFPSEKRNKNKKIRKCDYSFTICQIMSGFFYWIVYCQSVDCFALNFFLFSMVSEIKIKIYSFCMHEK